MTQTDLILISNRTYAFSAPVDISHIYSLESSQMLEK